jgi:prepilin-type processing-associated H-X9-DG protein
MDDERNEPLAPVDLSYARMATHQIGRSHSNRLIGYAAIGIVLLGLTFLALLFASRSGKTLSRRMACASNLRGIGNALYIYARDGGAFPEREDDWSNRLMLARDIVPKQLLCPDIQIGQTSYYYVPGYTMNSDPNQVLVYENPANNSGKGGNVLFVDGRVWFVAEPAYSKLISSIKLPNGKPFAPHRSKPAASSQPARR